MAGGHNEGRVNTLLHIATISGVLACLMRHFRASLSSLPLLLQPVSSLPMGTWSPEARLPALEGSYAEVLIPPPPPHLPSLHTYTRFWHLSLGNSSVCLA